MKILMLSWEYPPRIVGGIARHVQNLAEALVYNGIEVYVVTLEHPKQNEFSIGQGVKIFRVKQNSLPPSPLSSPEVICGEKFINFVREFNFSFMSGIMRMRELQSRPDLIHCHDWLVTYPAVLAKRGYHRPMIATIHATEMGRNHGIHNDLQRYIHHLEWHLTYEAWRVICCSNYMKKEIMLAHNTPADKIEVIPNGIHPKKYKIRFNKESFRKNYAKPKEALVLYVGRMVREKGVEVLIDAADLVLRGYPNCKFLIVGGGYNEHLKRKASALGIKDKIIFTGFVNDNTLTKIYNIVDCAVYPSLYEPFGIVALEAMAAGVPVVTSDVGGFREVIEHGVTGIHTWANNANSLAGGILQILNKPNLRKDLVNSAKKVIKTRFNWDTIAKRTIEVYKEVLKEYRKVKW